MKVFIILCKVHALTNAVMPASISKAFVNCYTHASSYQEAGKKILNKLRDDGIYLDDIESPIYEMPIENWEIHIKEQYKNLSSQMLTQSEFEIAIAEDKVVYGIFGGFN
ncbi:hypothetical protein OZX61_12305 (plasmid) [Acinetobacter sp. ESL0695]|uniref:hypothetical protein n=1 Tax=Acinetobacter sp. ESL0695 TaxID=2983215 RepID=UPI0023F1BB28|nr:hypothetical protein [Acinetobacter sp. ESL0695]WEV50181.1 hypothetical protein OZX61_12305 [Acinetobacter sp. ESL0695]